MLVQVWILVEVVQRAQGIGWIGNKVLGTVCLAVEEVQLLAEEVGHDLGVASFTVACFVVWPGDDASACQVWCAPAYLVSANKWCDSSILLAAVFGKLLQLIFNVGLDTYWWQVVLVQKSLELNELEGVSAVLQSFALVCVLRWRVPWYRRSLAEHLDGQLRGLVEGLALGLKLIWMNSCSFSLWLWASALVLECLGTRLFESPLWRELEVVWNIPRLQINHL